MAKIIASYLKLLYNTFKFHLTGSRWSMTSSKLCSLRTCQRCSVSIDRSINDLKLIKKFFSATNASADAKEEKKTDNLTDWKSLVKHQFKHSKEQLLQQIRTLLSFGCVVILVTVNQDFLSQSVTWNGYETCKAQGLSFNDNYCTM